MQQCKRISVSSVLHWSISLLLIWTTLMQTKAILKCTLYVYFVYTFIKSLTTDSQLNVKSIRREQRNGTNNFEPNGTNNFELSLNNRIYQLMWQNEQFSYWIVSMKELIEGNTVLLLFCIHKLCNFPNKCICWERSMWFVVVHLTYAVRLDWFCFEICPKFPICSDDVSNRNDYPNLNM